MRIVLARHGETSWNAEGRSQGQTNDIPLADRGRAQARAMGARLRDLPLVRAVASPLLRARETAELALGDRAGLLTLDPRLMEISHGQWEGRLSSEIQAAFPDVHKAWRETPHEVTLPGGESLRMVEARAWDAFREACAGLGPEDGVLLVAHDAVTRVLLCKVLGLGLDRVWSFRQGPACLNLLEGTEPGRLQIVRLNDAAHLTPLFGEPVHRKL